MEITHAPPYTREEMAERLREARTARGLTLWQAARLANRVTGLQLRDSSVSNAERRTDTGKYDFARAALATALLEEGPYVYDVRFFPEP